MLEQRYNEDAEFRLEKRKRALKRRAWELILKGFRSRNQQGLSQADFARLVGKKPEQVNRILKQPRNMTLDSLATYLSALELYADINTVDPTDPKQCGNTGAHLKKATFHVIPISNATQSATASTPSKPVVEYATR